MRHSIPPSVAARIVAAAGILIAANPLIAADDLIPPGAADTPSIGRRRVVSPGALRADAVAADTAPGTATGRPDTPATPPPPKTTARTRPPSAASPTGLPAVVPSATRHDAATATATATTDPALAPRIVFGETDFNFGTADQTDEVSHTFRFRNDGKSTLKVGRVHAHCGCTVIDSGPREIPPGGDGEITARVRLRGFRGKVQKGIDVFSNDPARPTVRLTIAGNVKVDIDIRPAARIFFGRLRREDESERQIEVRSNLEEPLGITGAGLEWEGRVVSAEQIAAGNEAAAGVPFRISREDLEPGRNYRFTLATIPPLPFGTASTALVLQTDSPKHPVVRVPITAYVLAPVTASPSAITFSRSHMNYNRRPIYVRRDDGSDLTIESVVAEPPQLKTHVRSMADLRTVRIEVTLTDEPPESLEYGRITIRTDHPEFRELVVKVKFVN